jgi:hypothetical protein
MKHVKQIALYAVLALSPFVPICSVFLLMGKEYHCDYKKVCKGVLWPVTRATFHWHEKYCEEVLETGSIPEVRSKPDGSGYRVMGKEFRRTSEL